MQHLGDITKISGYTAPIVDIITGGSPCQDLSVAGKRQGLAGERSGLFMEQVRIVREMRNADRANGRSGVDVRPRFMVWENVPGAFSSNKGEDFRAVLEEIAKVEDKDTVIPKPPGGRWSPSGTIVGNGWSIAWRVHDAQFWGVPQRRKRIALVADFGGQSAPKILFERKGVSRDIEPSEETRQGTAGTVKSGVGVTSQSMTTYRKTSHAKSKNDGQGWQETHINDTINAFDNGESRTPTLVVGEQKAYGISSYESNAMKSKNPNSGVYETDTARTLDNNGGNPACNQGGVAVVYDWHRCDIRMTELKDVCCTASAAWGSGGNNMPMVMETSFFSTGKDVTPTIKQRDYKDPQCVAYGLDRASYNQGKNAKFGFSVDTELIGAQTAKGPGAICNSIVRRLTPLECERLQGYPDGFTDIGEWTDSKGKKHKPADSPRYKALGNSIALPFWQWMADRIVKQYDRPTTMASLFDGIGGFPLVFQRCGCNPVWASEIEEFPMAVTKLRF